MIDIKRHHQQRVIVATSGRRNAFVDQLVRRLVRAGLHVDSLNNFSLHGDWSAARGPLTYDWKCGAACLESAVDLAGQFATSERLLLSSASGMGRFLLAWWGAANGNGTPLFVDFEVNFHLTWYLHGSLPIWCSLTLLGTCMAPYPSGVVWWRVDEGLGSS